MNAPFRHNDLRFYIRALFEMSGIDARYLAPGFEDVIQAEPATIEGILETEDSENAQHMETHWLMFDRALQAVGMRESSGYSKNSTVEGLHDQRSKKSGTDRNAYIGLARLNAEQSKGYLQNVPLAFEMVANNPDTDGTAVQGVNRWRDEILNQNNFTAHYNKFIADGHDFGSGILYNPYRPANNGVDDWFLEERARQGQPIEWDEYEQMQIMAKSHVIEHLDTFSVIRDRRARGEASADFAHPTHTITTWMETMTVTEAMQQYPKFKDKIKPDLNDLFMRLNPSAYKFNRDDLLITRKKTWIQCPVRYEMTYDVHVGNNIIVPKKETKTRTVILCLERLEGVGIVNMTIDQYAHGEVPLTMWQRRPSKFHSYGIGAFKDMWAAEWAYNIAFNGKFHWFNRMSKGGGLYLKGKGGLTEEQMQQRTTEQSWIGIDIDELPPGLREKGISSLIYDSRPQNFPSVYDALELSMEAKVKDTGGWHSVSGAKSGSSGRQELILRNTAESGMETIVGNLEAAQIPLGRKFHSNIIQFDSDKHISFTYMDPASGQPEQVDLNQVIGEVPEYNLETQRWTLFPYEVKNSIKSLKYSTQIATRSIVPVNPTERRFWWLDTLAAIQPFTMSEEGIRTLELLDRHVYNGLFKETIGELKQLFAQRSQMQNEMMMRQDQRESNRQQHDETMEVIDRRQNKYRLEQKAMADLLKAIAAFQKGDNGPLQQVLTKNPNLSQQLNA